LITTNPSTEARLKAIYQELGNRISRARKKTKLSQHDLALRVGLKRTSITNIEKGRQKVMVHTLLDVAKHLNVDALELLPRDKDAAVNQDVVTLIESSVSLRPDALRFIRRSALKVKTLRSAS
jgi:transcriptional regulator with XRE-family HTH domain